MFLPDEKKTQTSENTKALFAKFDWKKVTYHRFIFIKCDNVSSD